MPDFTSRLASELLVLDGAMGTMIMRCGLDEADFRGAEFADHNVALRGCNDVLAITRPDVIADIHRQYLEAGADIISTDTFNANRLSLADYHLADRVGDICRAAAAVARRSVSDYCELNRISPDRRPFVAGSMGPTGVSLSIEVQQNADKGAERFDEMAAAYEEQAAALISGGVDLLLLETIFDTLNAKAASLGIQRAFQRTGRRLPLMVSATLTEQGRLLSGQTLGQFVEAMRHCGAVSFGLNCGFGADALARWVGELSEICPVYVSCHPNAGLPDQLGRYLDTPEKMAAEIAEMLSARCVNIIGGCCGTTPDHIRLIADEARRHAPRRLPQQNADTAASGFIKVGERCNVAGSRRFLRLVSQSQWRECLDIAASQIESGASVLDINMDDALLDASQAMARFVTLLSGDHRTAATPLMIDSSDFNVISRAMRLMPLRGIVNSISLKNGEEEFLQRAREIHQLGCAMVVMAFDEQGQADTFERRIEICSRAYRLLTEAAGLPAEDIIFDPNVLAVVTGIADHDAYGLDFLRATRWIHDNLPGARVSGGISNLSFSFRGIDSLRRAMHSVFLSHGIDRGLSMAIINPSTPLSADDVDPELRELIDDVLLCRRPDATDRLVARAASMREALARHKQAKGPSAAAAKASDSESNNISARDRLADALLEGESGSLPVLVEDALRECDGEAMRVVEQSLMRGMDRVGELFSRGELFLPQVVRSASIMQQAVDLLTPIIERQQEEASSQSSASASSGRPRVVLATVKGDVHDIGKNIVAIVMRCSGYDVIDLGVMTPGEAIVDEAIRCGASAVALSGLITPSLAEMADVASLMEQRGLSIPLFVGGATTSQLHTALRIAPAYPHGSTVQTASAAALPAALRRFIDSPAAAFLEQKEAQRRLREAHLSRTVASPPLLSLPEAARRSEAVTNPAPAPAAVGEFTVKIAVDRVQQFINWRAFLGEWGLDPSDSSSPEAARLLGQAREELTSIGQRQLTARIVIAPARSSGDDLLVSLPSGAELCLPTLRSLSPNPATGLCPALSDFVTATDGDHLALFVVTAAGSGLPELIESLTPRDPFRALLLQSLSHRLAEAATEWMHRYVAHELWQLPAGHPAGIRPAIGYPSLPDQSLVHLLDEALRYRELAVTPTTHGALSPTATTTGLLLFHPSARYFSAGPQTPESIADYSRRRHLPPSALSYLLQ